MVTSRVFVIQQPVPNGKGWEPNLEPASKFGIIQFVFSGSDRPFQDPDGAIMASIDALQSFHPETDYILWPNCGDYAGLYAFCMMVGTLFSGRKVRFLYWQRQYRKGERDSHNGYYIPITFRIPAIN